MAAPGLPPIKLLSSEATLLCTSEKRSVQCTTSIADLDIFKIQSKTASAGLQEENVVLMRFSVPIIQDLERF